MKISHLCNAILITLFFFLGSSNLMAKAEPVVKCFDTGHTIMKVRLAKVGKSQIIIASDYNGVMIAIDCNGKMLWKSVTGKGTINHDIWCEDVTGDGTDEIFAANGNGTLYCLDSKGKIVWTFTPQAPPHIPPMYSVCVVKDASKTPYIVCGAFDNNCYYLSAKGQLIKTLYSQNYSKIKGWGDPTKRPANFLHYANFLRPLPQKDGSDMLIMAVTNNHMQNGGQIYVMKPLEEQIYSPILNHKLGSEITDLRVVDPDGDGKYEILYGGSTLTDIKYAKLKFNDDSYKSFVAYPGVMNGKNAGVAAYRVNQLFPYYKGDGKYGYALIGADQIFDLSTEDKPFVKNSFKEHYQSKYTFNDVWTDKSGKLILASSQDGGSCVYVINTTSSSWMKAYANIEPKGKIAEILSREAEVRKLLSKYKKPSWQRDPVKVIDYDAGVNVADNYSLHNTKALEFYGSYWGRGIVEKTDWRKGIYDGTSYLERIDRRNKYILSEEECVNNNISAFNNANGMGVWAGHGNDPLYYSLSTLKKIAQYGWEHGKKSSCFIWPEMNNNDSDFKYVVDKHIMPLAEYLDKINGKIAIRTKDIFFSGTIYLPVWKRYVSGEFANVFIPEMEETTDKTQDISLMGRMGLWMAGSVNGWGIRCSRDEVSFDRSRQFSSQKLANHFFRKTLFSMACGASYIHNTYMNLEHMELYLELVNKEALFIPKREELLSISPVHIGMTTPQMSFIEQGENNKWNTYFNRKQEDSNPALFSHMNGSWMGGEVTPWDFSTIASGVIDRRQNILPPYPNGMVLITPVQEGALADKTAPRGKMVDKMHPIYKNILKEYITDGVDYISSDGKTKYKANEFYKQVSKDITDGANKLPVVVSSIEGGKAAWVVAQMSPTHLRLTLVDGGYLNPCDTKVQVKFNGINPIKIYDVLDKKEFKCSNSSSIIDVPCGMFRFIDIELDKPLK